MLLNKLNIKYLKLKIKLSLIINIFSFLKLSSVTVIHTVI